MLFLKGIFAAALMSTFCFASFEDHLISSENIKFSQKIPLEGWLDDFSEAKKIAQEKQCPMLIAFLGPNWCPWSDKLETEILSNSIFLKQLQDTVVFVKIDIPENFSEITSSSELKKNYRIEECPTLVLVQPSGKEIAKLEYLPIESGEFASYIKQMLTDYEKVSQLQKKN